MKTSKQQKAGNNKAEREEFKYVVKVLEGTDLRMEPHLNPKTAGGDDNVILSLPFLTVLLEVSDGQFQHDDDKNVWVLVRPENGDKTGWVDRDFLVFPFKSKVTASQGTDLRREPTPEAKTEHGKDNVICSLPAHTPLLIIDYKRYDDESIWSLVRSEIDKNEKVGWVIPRDIQLPPMGGDSQGQATVSYTFKYGGKERTIYDANLKTALSDGYKYLSAKKLGVTDEIVIELKRNMPKGKKTKYWTTKAKIKNITVYPDIS